MFAEKVADLEEAVSTRNKVVAAASRSVAPSRVLTSPFATAGKAVAVGAAANKEATKLPGPVQEDTDGPDPILWAMTSAHEIAGVKDRLESWGAHRRGAREGAGSDSSMHTGSGSRLPEEQAGSGVHGRREWPRRVRLRTRLGKRCRKDLVAGRAGILIKATFNPLEGDSSGSKASKPVFFRYCRVLYSNVCCVAAREDEVWFGAMLEQVLLYVVFVQTRDLCRTREFQT